MRYYKELQNGYILTVGYGSLDGIEITEEEYNTLLGLILNKPTAPNGYEYWLTESGEYELHEAEPMPEPEPTADELLDILFGGEDE